MKNTIKNKERKRKVMKKMKKNCKSYLNRDYGAGDGSAEFC